jgi:hypothetical protein
MKILEFLHGLTNWSDFVSSMKEIGRKKSPLLPKFVKPLHEQQYTQIWNVEKRR